MNDVWKLPLAYAYTNPTLLNLWGVENDCTLQEERDIIGTPPLSPAGEEVGVFLVELKHEGNCFVFFQSARSLIGEEGTLTTRPAVAPIDNVQYFIWELHLYDQCVPLVDAYL